MKKTKKAVGYVCDIPIPKTDLVISKEDQRARILKYAQQENIELITIFDDEVFTEELAKRPGLQKLLNCKECFDAVLVERAWCLTRRMRRTRNWWPAPICGTA
jgi:DNA invertase Pin-like site-specific DNA recombinase